MKPKLCNILSFRTWEAACLACNRTNLTDLCTGNIPASWRFRPLLRRAGVHGNPEDHTAVCAGGGGNEETVNRTRGKDKEAAVLIVDEDKIGIESTLYCAYEKNREIPFAFRTVSNIDRAIEALRQTDYRLILSTEFI
ncbi:MAG TPA: hypothetical protein VM141_08605, partial [Planctomycetota bacterium]|nr:hypothetical protein [Planctomycetota bacterium]